MRALPLLAFAALAACGDHNPDVASAGPVDGGDCTCAATYVSAGIATLHARTSQPDDAGFEQAVISFKYGSTDESVTNNRWDLLYGNDLDPDRDELRVNTVVGDDSYIVDLGAIPMRDVPAVVVSPPGEACDLIDAVEGHLYYVRSHYDDTRQVAVFGITAHTMNESIDISWFRSTDPDTFVLSTSP
jgi:hypothetical protein